MMIAPGCAPTAVYPGPPSWKTGEVVTAPFGVGYALGCAYVDNDKTVWAYASKEQHSVAMFSSTSLTPASQWTQAVALDLGPGYTVFNTAVAGGKLGGTSVHAMVIEVRHTALGDG